MATGSPVSFWYGTRAQFDSITTKLDTTLYFITDEQALYKGTVKFSGSGVDTLLTISATEPTASSVTTGDKYFNTSDNLIHVLKNEDGTVTTTATYEPANGALYYNADAQRFQTLIKDGSSYIPTEIYDAGISVEDGTGLVLSGTTVAGLDATTNSKGVVKVGTNISVSNGVISVPVATNVVFGVVKSGDNITNTNGVLSVAKATTSSLGVVKPGDNINVDNNGQISVPVASTSVKGVLKVAAPFSISDGTLDVGYASTSAKGVIKIALPFSISDGVLGIASATTSAKGAVKVGTNIDVADGVISVKDASTSDKGVVQLVNDTSSEDIYSKTKAITPWVVKFMYDDLYGGKQDNISCDTPLNLDVNRISLAYGDGLAVGVTGTTNANKLIVNEASVKEVLEDVVDGGTEPAVNEIVTADNLKGALSVGQAVDVTSVPTAMSVGSGNTMYVKFGNEDWVQVSGSDYWKTVPFNKVLAGFKLRFVNNSSSVAYVYLGFITGRPFPKFADTLSYLSIADITNIGEVTASRVQFSVGEGTGYVISRANTLAKNESIRLASVFTSTQCLFYPAVPANSTVDFQISNWRQYEVTALTDEAIAYIAQLENPDDYFRSNTIDTVKNKYLVKNDMVCPWIKTISMPDNSDLTVASGLAYKIKYTNNSTHTITADTIPADAYGQDAHIKMFIKGTSAIHFTEPLVLMDALTPNAGHNLSVKFRDGQAFVYVDDTDAGYVVTVASGNTNGTLNYAITGGTTDYAIFSADLDGTTVDAGTVTFVGTSENTTMNILGNGTDKTSITGNISVNASRTMNLQSLAIDGGTIGGAGTLSLDDTAVEGSVYVESPATMRFSTVNVLNGTVSGSGKIAFADGATVTSVVPSGSTIGTGLITGFTVSSAVVSRSATFENISITDFTPDNEYGGVISAATGVTVVLRNCYIRHTATDTGRFIRAIGGDIVMDGCISEGSISGARYLYVYNDNSTIYINDSNLVVLRVGRGNAMFSGNSTVDSFQIGVTGGTNYTGVITITDGSTVTFNTVSFGQCKIYTHVVGHATLIAGGLETGLSGCTFQYISSAGNLIGNPNITVDSMSVWSAENAVFASPLDASAAGTIKLSGTTFYAAARTLNASRIQLPASTTVSFSGNTNPADTRILEAPVIVVGDDAAAPSGSATVVNAAGTASTVSGIGTYIDKEGDNDFVALSNVSVVNTSAASGSGSLAAALTGSNKFVRIANNTVGTVGEATDAVDKTVMTNDYEPILGGTFSLTSATVNEATKTTTILSGGTMTLGDAYIPSGSTVAVSGGGLAVEKVTGAGSESVIDLNQSALAIVGAGGYAYASGVVFTNGFREFGGAINASNGYGTFSSCAFSDCSARVGAAAHITGGGSKATVFKDCVFSGNTGSGCVTIFNRPAIFSNCTFSDNNVHGSSIWMTGSSTVYSVDVSDCTFAISQGICFTSTGVVNLSGSNSLLGTIGGRATKSGTVTLTSGAVLDLTGNTNATPIAPGGGIVFEDNVTVKYGTTESPSSCTISGGSVSASIGNTGNMVFTSAQRGIFGTITFDKWELTVQSTTINPGNTAVITLKDCSIISTSAAMYISASDKSVTVNLSGTLESSSPITFYYNDVSGNGVINIADGTAITLTNAGSNTRLCNTVGTVTIGTGCTINGNVLTAGTYSNCTIAKDGTITEA